MASKPNADVGTIDCPIRTCAEVGRVRKMAKGRRKGHLYVHCPKHGPVMLRGDDFQEHILNAARMHGPDGEPAHVPEPPAASPASHAPDVPASIPKPSPPKRGFLDW